MRTSSKRLALLTVTHLRTDFAALLSSACQPLPYLYIYLSQTKGNNKISIDFDSFASAGIGLISVGIQRRRLYCKALGSGQIEMNTYKCLVKVEVTKTIKTTTPVVVQATDAYKAKLQLEALYGERLATGRLI